MRNRILWVLTLVILVAAPLCAHRLALKDGQTIQFDKYRVTEKILFYTGSSGKEIAIPLADVDLSRTQQLNAGETVPLDLPGLVPSSPWTTNGNEPSLADIARQQRKDNSKATAKRVLTDDDVVHSAAPVPTAQAVPADDPTSHAQSTQKLVDSFANKTAAQLAAAQVGASQFPGRDVWEERLYTQAQRVLKFGLAYLERTRKLETLTDYAERNATLDVIKDLDWQLNVEMTEYTKVAAEGSEKANKWEKAPR